MILEVITRQALIHTEITAKLLRLIIPASATCLMAAARVHLATLIEVAVLYQTLATSLLDLTAADHHHQAAGLHRSKICLTAADRVLQVIHIKTC